MPNGDRAPIPGWTVTEILRMVLPAERRNAGARFMDSDRLTCGPEDAMVSRPTAWMEPVHRKLCCSGTAGAHHHFGQSLGLGRTSGGAGRSQNHGLGSRRSGMKKKVKGCLRWWLSAPPCVWGGVTMNARSPRLNAVSVPCKETGRLRVRRGQHSVSRWNRWPAQHLPGSPTILGLITAGTCVGHDRFDLQSACQVCPVKN